MGTQYILVGLGKHLPLQLHRSSQEFISSATSGLGRSSGALLQPAMAVSAAGAAIISSSGQGISASVAGTPVAGGGATGLTRSNASWGLAISVTPPQYLGGM